MPRLSQVGPLEPPTLFFFFFPLASERSMSNMKVKSKTIINYFLDSFPLDFGLANNFVTQRIFERVSICLMNLFNYNLINLMNSKNPFI